jgi:hypothetical protein
MKRALITKGFFPESVSYFPKEKTGLKFSSKRAN